MAKHRFKKGHKKIGGRAPGTPNKFTTLRQSFLDAFQILGGTEGLAQWAKSNGLSKKEFYSMTSKMLPKEINVNVEGTLTLAEKIKEARSRAGKEAIEDSQS